jgi:hypothetical protein
MKKYLAIFVLLLFGIFANCSPVLAFQPYRSGGTREIDSNYRLKADGGGGISLRQRSAGKVIFEVQGSGNSEYCAKKTFVFIRVVPLAKSENESEELPEYLKYSSSPDTINLPGQPYAYYIFEKDTANMIGPLTEGEFTSHNLVAHQKIKWKYIEKTEKEYSRGMRILGLYLLFVLFCIYVLPFLVLLAAIIYVIRTLRGSSRKKIQTVNGLKET